MKEIATILGVPVVPYTMDEAIAKLTHDTLQRKRNFVVTANAEIIMMAQNDKEYKTLLAETADVILPDGAGTVWAGNYLGYTVPERVAGYDLYLRLLEEAARNKIPVYFSAANPVLRKKLRRKANAVGPVCMWPAAATGIFRRKKNRRL